MTTVDQQGSTMRRSEARKVGCEPWSVDRQRSKEDSALSAERCTATCCELQGDTLFQVYCVPEAILPRAQAKLVLVASAFNCQARSSRRRYPSSGPLHHRSFPSFSRSAYLADGFCVDARRRAFRRSELSAYIVNHAGSREHSPPAMCPACFLRAHSRALGPHDGVRRAPRRRRRGS